MSFFRPKKYKKGYATFREEGKNIFVHRRTAEKKYKVIPKGFHVHHIDEDKTNNRPDNLILLHWKDHDRVHRKKDLLIENKK